MRAEDSELGWEGEGQVDWRVRGSLRVCVLGDGQRPLLAHVVAVRAEDSARSHLPWSPRAFQAFPLCPRPCLSCWSW